MSQQNVAIIYVLSDPRTQEVRYVGKAINLRNRLAGHLSDKRPSHRANWIACLRKAGLKPIIEELEKITDANDEAWQEAERFWIEVLRFYGCRLTNLDSGGSGGKRLSQATKNKLSAIRTGKKLSPEHVEALRAAGYGRKPTLETRAKMSAWQKGRKTITVEQRAKLSAKMKGRKNGPPSAETRAKMSAALIGRTGKRDTQETRAKKSAAAKLRPPVTLAARNNISLGLTGRVFSQETRAKMSAATKAHYAKKRAAMEDASGRVVLPNV